MKLDRREVGLAGAAGLMSIAAGAHAAETKGAPEAVTRQGRVRGFRRNGAELFLGLPYGADTSGERRFMPPSPPAKWSGVRDATRLGQRAPQASGAIYDNNPIAQYMTGGRAEEIRAFDEPMGEDCLVLNVLTPAADKRGRPVMVYMHGGGFDSGSGAVHTLGDRFVVEEDVVLVTVNHRLSLLGYLYLGDISPR
ncbi:MAG TPA: carboxylesterase family protein, partial [Caulobacteraceae bacterium]|nr:carboxylesterase family protein [Caulobacteraceae bacterium]